MPGSTVAEVLETACARYGDRFGEVLAGSRVWVNGEPARDDDAVRDDDEVAVLPPVSGGAVELPSDDVDVDGPHVRLGLLWAVGTTVAAVIGPVVLALWFAPVAGLAAMQAARTWKGQTPMLLVAAPLVLAAAAPVVLRTQGFPEAFALLALVWAYDAGAYIVGTGAVNRWEGPAAGVAAVFSVTLAVAVVFAPPFEGALPWVFGAVVAVAGPFRDRALARVLGEPGARVPIVRRLGTLVTAGPPFALLGLLLLR